MCNVSKNISRHEKNKKKWKKLRIKSKENQVNTPFSNKCVAFESKI